MTDPNAPRDDRPHVTINNPAPERKGGGGMALVLGAVVVVLAIIAFLVFNNQAAVPDPRETNIDLNVDIPAPQLPEAPRLPDAPTLPPVEPPTVPAPPAG